MSIRSYWLMVLFTSVISPLIFCVIVLSVAKKVVFKSLNIILDFSISPFNSYQFLLDVFQGSGAWWTQIWNHSVHLVH